MIDFPRTRPTRDTWATYVHDPAKVVEGADPADPREKAKRLTDAAASLDAQAREHARWDLVDEIAPDGRVLRACRGYAYCWTPGGGAKCVTTLAEWDAA